MGFRRDVASTGRFKRCEIEVPAGSANRCAWKNRRMPRSSLRSLRAKPIARKLRAVAEDARAGRVFPRHRTGPSVSRRGDRQRNSSNALDHLPQCSLPGTAPRKPAQLAAGRALSSRKPNLPRSKISCPIRRSRPNGSPCSRALNANAGPHVIVATRAAPRSARAETRRVALSASLLCERGSARNHGAIPSNRLVEAGYERVAQVTTRGQFAVRGGILDLFSWQAQLPVRAEFFGDEIESLREFDVDTQTSVRNLQSVRRPARSGGRPKRNGPRLHRGRSPSRRDRAGRK